MSAPQGQGKPINGVVKQVISGDTIVIRGQPMGGPPPEKTITLCNVTAPKLERWKGNDSTDESKDEPYAWKAREFLRKKVIGQEVHFVTEKSINTNRTYGTVWLGKDKNGENVIETLVSEGLVTVKKDTRNPSPEQTSLIELENAAKAAKKGKWSESPSSEHIRDVKWTVDDPRKLVEKFGKKPVKAIIEFVFDGSTVKALLLPDFYNVVLMISGVRCPGWPNGRRENSVGDPYADEARYFVESRLLHRDVEVVLESVNNNNFIGSILHPKGNIAEILLSEGFAKCQDWSISNSRSGAEKLYLAEKAAKEARLRLWKDYKPSGPQIEFTGTVVEIVNADALIIRTQNGENKKVFLSSIRPPSREKRVNEEPNNTARKDFKPLYDIPWMLEAREFLREKFIRKNVKVVVDYTQPARDNFPEKLCCTVTCGKTNIAEALVARGLVRVIKYRQNDDQRSSHYDLLQVAESKAEKSQHGLHAKKDIPVHRLVDLSNDPSKAKAFLTSLKRAQGIKAVVEFVTSGSRLKLYLPKEDQLITFVLAGIRTPRCQRSLPGGGVVKADEYGEKALAFTREHCFQRDVEIKIENTETKGSGFIGWLTVNDINMSVSLVEEGLAEVVTFPDFGELTRTLKAAEERAKSKKLNMWKNFVEVQVENDKNENDKEIVERKVDYQEVVISEVTEDLHFYVQNVDQRSMLENLLSQLRQELSSNPPLPGAYKPVRGDLAVAKFTGDDQWYRVKTEKVFGTNVSVFYIDYGNRETINVTRVADLPSRFATDKPYAREHTLACVALPSDNDDKKAAVEAFKEDVMDKVLLLNTEYKLNSNVIAVTLLDSTTNEDIAKGLIADGLLLVQNQRDRRLTKLIEEYKKAEEDAKHSRRNIWRYGDIRVDDEKEFGL
ncbi:staphylococcal nuclease domain-containing protein 1 [Hylaeus anthracinus]|uniref:staphylococcal nuclease domain-containing protein 1 n=1 Tax=Hylaeus anthracinus TaxID=313031 RepID=UPI0023B9D39B|nr:staphylococcal nuclease domain-containing protein 1 [Hylaeus anthracinus]